MPLGSCISIPANSKRSTFGLDRASTVKSDFGEVVVRAIKSPYGPHPGIVFIPMGPWANQVVDPETNTTGMPSYKGIMVTITPAPGKKVLGAIDLIKTTTQGGVEA